VGKPHPRHQDLLQGLFTNLTAAETLLRTHPELVHSCDDAGETALHYAIVESNLEAARVLLAHGADVNARDHGGKPPLLNAAIVGNPDVVKFLLSRGADPTLQDENFDTALHYALWAKEPSAAIIDALLQAGADPKVTNSLDETPLDVAEGKNLQDIAAKFRAKS
jgi:ankyrin repeat protein